MQHAATGHLDAALVLKLVDAHGDVALLLAQQTLLQLARAHDVAFAAHQGAGGGLEHDGHGRLLHGDGLHGHRALGARQNIADVGILYADDRHDVARVDLGHLGLAQVLEGVHLAHLRLALGAVGLHHQHGLLLVQRAAVQAADADAALVAAVVHRAHLQGHRAFGIHLGRRHLGQDGVEQRHHVHVAVLGIKPRIAVDGRGVHHGEVQLLVRGAQLHHQVEHLVHRALGVSVGAVYLVHHHHDAQAPLERMAQHEAGLGLGALVGIDDEQRAVGHVEHALHLAAEVGMAGRVDDVYLHVLVVDGDVLRQDGDAALALLVVGVQHALFDLLVLAEHMAGPQQAVHERGLAVVDVGDDGNVAYAVLLHFGSLPLAKTCAAEEE